MKRIMKVILIAAARAMATMKPIAASEALQDQVRIPTPDWLSSLQY